MLKINTIKNCLNCDSVRNRLKFMGIKFNEVCLSTLSPKQLNKLKELHKTPTLPLIMWKNEVFVDNGKIGLSLLTDEQILEKINNFKMGNLFKI